LEIFEMKKTLIALAAVAATGASFAQVTISGQLGFSWQQEAAKGTDGSHKQGFSMNDGDVYLTATESLGAGWSATARGGWTMRGRGTAVVDRDGMLMLGTPNGTLTAGSFRTCGPLDAVKSGAVTGTAYTANESNLYIPIDKCSLIDAVSFSLPKFANTTVSVAYGELSGSVSFAPTITSTASAVATSTPVVTAGSTTTFGVLPNTQILDAKGNATGITFTNLAAVYADGPVMLQADITWFGGASSKTQISNSTVAGAFLLNDAGLDGWQRTRVTGTYDAGVAKVGLGYQNRTWGMADQYIATIAVPVGNMVFGLDYMARDAQGPMTAPAGNSNFALLMSSLNGQKAGDKASSMVGVGVTYNFSKTTTVNASYIQYTDAGVNVTNGVTSYTGGAAGNDVEYRIRLMKTF